MTRHVVTVIALLLSAALLMGASPSKGQDPNKPPHPEPGRQTITCYDVCTGAEFTISADHPNTANISIVDDFCASHTMQKTCVQGSRHHLLKPTPWTGAIWKTPGWGYWGL